MTVQIISFVFVFVSFSCSRLVSQKQDGLGVLPSLERQERCFQAGHQVSDIYALCVSWGDSSASLTEP